MTKIACPLARQARRYPQALALITAKHQWTYPQLNGLVDDAVNHFIAAGIKRGARIALISGPSAQQIIVLLALWRIGAVACLISPRLPDNEITRLCRRLGLRIADLKPLTNAFGKTQTTLKTAEGKNFLNLNNLSTIMFTSGSCGQPKAVVHTIANHYYNALGSNQNIAVKPYDRWLLSLPLYHVSGLSILWRCLLGGGTIVIPDDTKSLADNIGRYSVTHVSLVTTQVIRLLREENSAKTLQNLKCILLGGGPIGDDLIEQCRKRRLPLHITYGLTEMASQVATSQRGAKEAFVLPYRQIKISALGEITVRGKTLFKGYVQGSRIIRPLKNGWYHTGDLGSYNTREGLKILGRKDNMFISGGENIYPEEIEHALLRTQLIEQAVVVPLADTEFGFRPAAFIRPLRPAKILRGKLSKLLPGFKIPKRFYHLPLNTGLKPDRKQLQKKLTRLKDSF